MIKKLTFFFFLFILTKFSLGQDYTDYKYMHPKPQDNILQKIRMIDQNNWVTVGANGTFMRTSNQGVDWYFHNKAGIYANVAKLIGTNTDAWFMDQYNGFIIGATGFIGRTTNGGITFDTVGTGAVPLNQIGKSIWFADKNIGYAAFGYASPPTDGYLVKTTDGGVSWYRVLSTQLSSVNSVYGVDANTVYALISNGTISKTTDGGTTWNSITKAVPNNLNGLSFVNSTTGFVYRSASIICRTTDTGNTWQTLTPPDSLTSLISIKIVSSTEIYAVGQPGFLWKTTDLGDTWSKLPIKVTGPDTTALWYSIDVYESLMIICGEFGVVARSTDNGLTWNSNNFALTNKHFLDITAIPGSNNVIAVGPQFTPGGGDKNILFSSDGGNTWKTYNSGFSADLSAVSMVTPEIGYASGSNSKVLKTTDGGASWTPVTQPGTTNYTLGKIKFINESTGWVFVTLGTVPNGSIFKTTNGGSTWTQQTIGATNHINDVSMIDTSNGYICVYDGAGTKPIYKTTNGGLNWNPVTTPYTGLGMVTAIKAIDANNVIIGSWTTNCLSKTTNGGTTWTPFPLPFDIDVISIDFKDINSGYVAGELIPVIFKTTNGGSIWSFSTIPQTAVMKVNASQGDTVFVLGTYGAIFRYTNNSTPVELAGFSASISGNNISINWSTATETNNSGFDIERKDNAAEWNKIAFIKGKGTSIGSNQYSYIDPDLSYGSFTYRIKQIDYNGSSRYFYLNQNLQIGLPSGFDLCQNYPNPFNPATVITYQLPIKTHVVLKVYNILGIEVSVLVNEYKEPGLYSINFDAHTLPSGIYFYELSAGNFRQSRKMILIK